MILSAHREAAEREKKDLEEEIRALKNKVVEANDRGSKARASWDREKKALEAKNKQLALTIERMASEQQSRLQEMEREHAQTLQALRADANAALRDALEEAEASAREEGVRRARAEDELTRRDAEARALADAGRETEHRLRDAAGIAEEYRQQKQRLEEEIAALRHQVSQSQHAASKLENKLASERAERAARERAIQDLGESHRQQVESLDATRREAERKLRQEMEEYRKRKGKDLEEIQEKVSAIIARKDATIAALKEENRVLQSRVEAMDAFLIKSQEELRRPITVVEAVEPPTSGLI